MKKAFALILGLSLMHSVCAQTEAQSGSVSADTTEYYRPSAVQELPVIGRQSSGVLLCGPAILLSGNTYSGLSGSYLSAYADRSIYTQDPLPAWLIFSSAVQSYPGMMQKESGSVGLAFASGRFNYDAYVGAVKYGTFNSLVTSYYIGGSVSCQLSHNISMTLFGTYYSRNPYLGMAAYPFVHTSSFGGYFTMVPNSIFSLSMGVKSYYDPFRRRMETDPIIAPAVKIGKVRVGVDVGHAAKNYLRSIFHHWSR